MDDENLAEAIQTLQSTAEACSKFKTIYHECRETSTEMLPPERQWEASNEILFSRIDLFIERCEDILDFTKIVLEFSKLGKVHIGGTKCKSLTGTPRHIHG
jgi:hypothetical protein